MPKRGELKSNATARSKQQRAFNSTPEQKKRRAARNKARRQLMAKGVVKKGDGKDVDHKDKNASNNSRSNLRVRDQSANRADNRGTGGRKKKRSKPTKRT